MTQTKDVTGFTRKIRLQQQESESESEQGDEAESQQDEVNDTQESDEGVNSTDPNAKPTMKAIQQLTKWQVIKDMEKLKQDSCSICLCEFQDEEDEVNDGKIVKLSKCGDHYFHIDCIVQAFSHKKSCPACTTRYGIETGTQPRVGTMDSRVMHGSLPGFPRSKTIIIEYNFPNGVQGPEHPNPGKRYGGTSRVAYLPDTPEGNKVLRLFKQAFKQRVMFTVGTSITTGMSDCVIWNGIHHKTSRTGGASRFGYPDGTYLQRVQQELASKGIVEE